MLRKKNIIFDLTLLRKKQKSSLFKKITLDHSVFQIVFFAPKQKRNTIVFNQSAINDFLKQGLKNTFKKTPLNEPLEKPRSLLSAEILEDQQYTDQKALTSTNFDEPEYKLELWVSIDTEYTDDSFLSLQIVITGNYTDKKGVVLPLKKNIILIDRDYIEYFSLDLLDRLSKEKNCEFIFVNLSMDVYMSENSILLEYVCIYLYSLGISPLLTRTSKCFRLILLMYYSAKDLTCAFGRNKMGPIYSGTHGNLRSKGAIQGFFYADHKLFISEDKQKCINYKFRVIVKDLYKIEGGSLENTCTATGIEAPLKQLLNPYKKNMVEAMQKEPELFLRYGLFDAECLKEILIKKVEIFNNVLNDFGIVNDSFTLLDFPLSVGSIVNSVWSKYFKNNVWDTNNFYPIASVLQSTLNDYYPLHTQILNNITKIYDKYNSVEKLLYLKTNDNSEYLKLLSELCISQAILFSVIKMCGIEYLASHSPHSTMAFLALVCGGRAINEQPLDYRKEYTADVDISGAYGNELKKLKLPVGRPRIFITSPNEKKMLLGDFLKKNKNHLSGDYFLIIVKGSLPFEQDLIFSKLVKSSEVSKSIIDFMEEKSQGKYNSHFCLIRSEIENGIIIPSVLNLLKKVCTKKELHSIYNLEVVSAIYYSPLDEQKSMDCLVDAWLSDKGRNSFRKKKDVEDNRSYAWYGTPLKNFVGVLLDKRMKLKKEMKTHDKTSAEYGKLNALQNGYKLIINTFWGNLTSVYFPMSNTLLSNIVSGNTRVNVWKLSKALGLFMTITDGGCYSLTSVTFLKKNSKRPGLAVLSNYYLLKNHPSITIGPLGGLNWPESFNKGLTPIEFPFTSLDSLATTHLNNLWDQYDLPINFIIEHKIENTALVLAWLKKSHYCVLRSHIYNDLDDSVPLEKDKLLFPNHTCVCYKVRGARLDSSLPNFLDTHNPTFKLLTNIILGIDTFVYEANFQETGLLKISSWRSSLKDKNNPDSSTYGLGVFPGDSFKKNCYFRFNNDYIFFNNQKDYHTITRRSFNKSTAFFEKFSDKGIFFMYLMCSKNQLRTSTKLINFLS